MNRVDCINYLEIPCRDLNATKAFFAAAFGWQFMDYGPEYSCFLDVGIDGGFYQAPASFSAQAAPLIVLYSDNLALKQEHIMHHGGRIVRSVFSFPGGRRFHFACPSGNEYAVWSE
ncbi:VOC family protein [Shewanella sp. 3B26]|jgi:predicted enzyme related to lactoylglutathione lyase|uniref:VOC family protein n=1 Tax=Shewanella zhuhaiensis TaxID=2919576 RepID=A0AAJ1F016_9GAMM|nr:VOC family protein [Shewanella zhuhaiensis]MCH4294052.1 VOC family protein [Shewanella zhuhaiensis]